MKYYRRINKIVLCIEIDEKLYDLKYKIFESIFRSFATADFNSQINDVVFTYQIFHEFCSSSSNQYYSVCNIYYSDWIFILMNELENFYAIALKCTVLHSSCVRINSKNVLLVGERQSGKTTLTKYFSIDKGGVYLTDDCLYITDKSYIGFGMPLPMRYSESFINKCYFLSETMDADGMTRTLYQPFCFSDSFDNIDLVVFPRYSLDEISKREDLTQAETFKGLISNVRSHLNMKAMYLDLLKLAKNCTCCKLVYSNSEEAYRMLFGQ